MNYRMWKRLLGLALLVPASLFAQQSPAGTVIPTTGELGEGIWNG